MRFPILVAAAAISGGVAVFAFKTFFPYQNAFVGATAHKAISAVTQFDYSSLNPVQSAYDRVARDVQSPKPIDGLNFQPSTIGEIKMVPIPGMGPLNSGGGLASQPRWQSPVVHCGHHGVTLPCN